MTSRLAKSSFDQNLLLRLDDPAGVETFLRDHGWVEPNERIERVEKAGEGNMNLVVRVRTARRSAVLKQSRPWVEKYPQVAAPAERVGFERAFYRRVEAIPEVAERMPRVLAYEPAARALCLSDLGEAADFTTVYEGGSLRDHEIDALAGWAAALHRATRSKPDPAFANRAMRELNHQHIFALPLTDGLPVDLNALEPGLAKAAEALRNDRPFVRRASELGRLYLQDGPCLLHGDNYPGSWLRTEHGVRVIDPEFGFFGPPEFDAAVALAHVALAGLPQASADRWLTAYQRVSPESLDDALLAGFAGVEIMRRLIGLAQLPLVTQPGARQALLERARAAVNNDSLQALWG